MGQAKLEKNIRRERSNKYWNGYNIIANIKMQSQMGRLRLQIRIKENKAE